MIKSKLALSVLFIVLIGLFAFLSREKTSTMYLIGDSTMADYANYGDDYMKTRYPMTGWGQVFKEFLGIQNIIDIPILSHLDSVKVDNRAKGGRSTRTFFEEGRWSAVYSELKKGDFVVIQFGHNDASEKNPDRYVNVTGYKEYLRLFVNQSREKKATPIIVTPVSRNYPWEDNKLGNIHGEYYTSAVEVAKELDAHLIDLTQLSMQFFTAKGREYVTKKYFMNFEAGLYEVFPEGSNDNTHFQPEGAKAIAELVYISLKTLPKQ